ncbi:MAG TPA: hypothetical protein VGE63_03120 [Candidatus Paceibacterota bacterium]
MWPILSMLLVLNVAVVAMISWEGVKRHWFTYKYGYSKGFNNFAIILFLALLVGAEFVVVGMIRGLILGE